MVYRKKGRPFFWNLTLKSRNYWGGPKWWKLTQSHCCYFQMVSEKTTPSMSKISKKKFFDWVQSPKVCFLRTYLGKSFHPKIHKNCPVDFVDFNGAVFVNFWVKWFFQVSSLKKQTLSTVQYSQVIQILTYTILFHF